MTWRVFLASWIGAAAGHLSGGVGSLYRSGVLESFLTAAFADPWAIFFSVSGFLALSTLFAFVPFISYVPMPSGFKRFGVIPTRTNYFRAGLWAALFPWGAFLVAAGFKVDLPDIGG